MVFSSQCWSCCSQCVGRSFSQTVYPAVTGWRSESVFRQCKEMSPTAARCNGFPCISTKNSWRTGISAAREKFIVSVKGLGKRCPADCKTVYPGSIPGVASKSIDRSAQAPRRQTRVAAVDQIGPHIEGEAPRELLVVPRCLFQHRCLQTSCCVVQLRLQVPVLVDAAGFVAAAAVVGMQEFWQFIACVSQLT